MHLIWLSLSGLELELDSFSGLFSQIAEPDTGRKQRNFHIKWLKLRKIGKSKKQDFSWKALGNFKTYISDSSFILKCLFCLRLYILKFLLNSFIRWQKSFVSENYYFFWKVSCSIYSKQKHGPFYISMLLLKQRLCQWAI